MLDHTILARAFGFAFQARNSLLESATRTQCANGIKNQSEDACGNVEKSLLADFLQKPGVEKSYHYNLLYRIFSLHLRVNNYLLGMFA